jgi:hypothetical protein
MAELSFTEAPQVHSLMKSLNLFPNKIKNLQGRDIVLAIFNYNPYTMWKVVVRYSILDIFNYYEILTFILQNDSTNVINSYEKVQRTPLFIDGTESWVFIQLCKRINCTLLISLGKFPDNHITVK